MRITNFTDIARNTGVKVIGIGEFNIMPGETKDIPDALCYVMNGGKRVVAPSILAMARTNQIRYEETDNAAPVTAPAADEVQAEDAGEDEAPAEPEMTDEEKRKAEAAAKRAATRAANKAAKAGAADKAE